MLDSVFIFVQRNAARQWQRILFTTHPYLSGIISMIIAFDMMNLSMTIKLSTLANAFVTYNTVVFGFTATAVALAIAIPNERFVRFLSNGSSKSTAFRDFLFVLSWNGAVHFLAFFGIIPVIASGDGWILDSTSNIGMRLYFFFASWIQIYACFQFLVTTLSVYELADLYAQYVAKVPASIEQKPTPAGNSDRA